MLRSLYICLYFSYTNIVALIYEDGAKMKAYYNIERLVHSRQVLLKAIQVINSNNLIGHKGFFPHLVAIYAKGSVHFFTFLIF
jgi:hypothetical protein